MIRKRIVQLLLAAVAVTAVSACSAVGTSHTTSASGGPNIAATANPAAEQAAKLAADAMVPGVQSALQTADFKNVKVTTEMDDGKAVVTASVRLDQLRGGCSLNYESQVTSPGIYFDEVITPQKPGGIEVKGAARNTVSPKSAFKYVLANHPACLVPGAKAPKK